MKVVIVEDFNFFKFYFGNRNMWVGFLIGMKNEDIDCRDIKWRIWYF